MQSKHCLNLMHLKNVGKMYLKQTVFRQTILKQDVLETGTKHLSGTLFVLLTKYMLYLMHVKEVKTGLYGWMLTAMYTVIGVTKSLKHNYQRVHILHM